MKTSGAFLPFIPILDASWIPRGEFLYLSILHSLYFLILKSKLPLFIQKIKHIKRALDQNISKEAHQILRAVCVGLWVIFLFNSAMVTSHGLQTISHNLGQLAHILFQCLFLYYTTYYQFPIIYHFTFLFFP